MTAKLARLKPPCKRGSPQKNTENPMVSRSICGPAVKVLPECADFINRGRAADTIVWSFPMWNNERG